MEKKIRKSLIEAAYNRDTVTVELTSGFKFDAMLIPISSMVQLTDGYFGAAYIDTLEPTVTLIASYGGDTSEIT